MIAGKAPEKQGKHSILLSRFHTEWFIPPGTYREDIVCPLQKKAKFDAIHTYLLALRLPMNSRYSLSVGREKATLKP